MVPEIGKKYEIQGYPLGTVLTDPFLPPFLRLPAFFFWSPGVSVLHVCHLALAAWYFGYRGFQILQNVVAQASDPLRYPEPHLYHTLTLRKHSQRLFVDGQTFEVLKVP